MRLTICSCLSSREFACNGKRVLKKRPTCAAALTSHIVSGVKSPKSRAQQLCRELRRAMRQVAREPSPKSVHLLRISCRRLDVVLRASGSVTTKLRQRLRELRRWAGKARDLDAQVKALETLRLPSVADEQRRVARRLKRKRSRRQEKLSEAVAAQRKKTAEQLKHFCASPVGATRPAAAAHHDMLRAALDRFLQAAEKQRADDAAELHSFRIACKKARYMAEMAPPRAAQPIIADLKRIQDAIGDWRDWELLIESAEKALGDPAHSGLIAALRAQARSRMLHALRVRAEATERLLEARVRLAGKGPMRAGVGSTHLETRKVS